MPNSFLSVYDLEASDSTKWQLTADVCREIATLFEAASVPVVFVLLPAQVQLKDAYWDSFVDAYELDRRRFSPTQPNEQLGRVFRTAGLSLLDPIEDLKRVSKEQRLYGRVDPHLNWYGNRVVARFLQERLKPMLCYPQVHDSAGF